MPLPVLCSNNIKMQNAIHWFQITVIEMEGSIDFYSTILSVEFILTEALGAISCTSLTAKETGFVYIPNFNSKYPFL